MSVLQGHVFLMKNMEHHATPCTQIWGWCLTYPVPSTKKVLAVWNRQGPDCSCLRDATSFRISFYKSRQWPKNCAPVTTLLQLATRCTSICRYVHQFTSTSLVHQGHKISLFSDFSCCIILFLNISFTCVHLAADWMVTELDLFSAW